MAAKVSIVIIDDSTAVLKLLRAALATEDVTVFTASDPEAGLDLVFQEHPEIVLTDLTMPGLSGLDVLDRIVEFDPAIDVILMTAFPAAESAVEAMRRGASDYLSKPIRISDLNKRISRLVDKVPRRKSVNTTQDQIPEEASFEGMIGRSSALVDLSSRILRIAPHYRTVLVTGKTGTGKELVARALHNLSPVSAGRFVVLNCSAVVETLFESELFGHVRGSFTGAVQDKMGLFEYAHKGTIFLDEIGDMPLGTQAKLLRVLQNHEVLRVGSLGARRIDVRVIAATHRDLRQAIANRQFREDLYYRLSMVGIPVPGLTERREDLPLLIRHFVESFSGQFRKNIRGLTRRAEMVLFRHSWPGNVRELENAIGHGCMMASGDIVDVQDLPEYLQGSPQAPPATLPVRIDGPSSASFEDHEKRLVVQALMHAHGNQSMAAKSLRIGRDAIRYKMKKHGLDGVPIGKAS